MLLSTHETGGRREARGHLLRALIGLQLSVRASPNLTAPTVLILCVLPSISMHHHLRLLLLRSVLGGAHGHHHWRDHLLLLSIRASGVLLLLHLAAALRGGAHLHHLVKVVVLVHC